MFVGATAPINAAFFAKAFDDRSELVAAEEAFFCGTAWEVTPVTMIDKLPVGDGTIGSLTQGLQERYFDVCAGTSGAHPEWRMPVYAAAKADAAE